MVYGMFSEADLRRFAETVFLTSVDATLISSLLVYFCTMSLMAARFLFFLEMRIAVIRAESPLSSLIAGFVPASNSAVITDLFHSVNLV